MVSGPWWWAGLTDESRPKGQRAIGAIVVRADSIDFAQHAARGIAIAYGVDPALIVDLNPMGAEFGDPPHESWTNMVLNREQAERLAELWCGGFASARDIEKAFLDDNAKAGDPLFKAKP